jgi:hypothetical protein
MAPSTTTGAGRAVVTVVAGWVDVVVAPDPGVVVGTTGPEVVVGLARVVLDVVEGAVVGVSGDPVVVVLSAPPSGLGRRHVDRRLVALPAAAGRSERDEERHDDNSFHTVLFGSPHRELGGPSQVLPDCRNGSARGRTQFWR